MNGEQQFYEFIIVLMTVALRFPPEFESECDFRGALTGFSRIRMSEDESSYYDDSSGASGEDNESEEGTEDGEEDEDEPGKPDEDAVDADLDLLSELFAHTNRVLYRLNERMAQQVQHGDSWGTSTRVSAGCRSLEADVDERPNRFRQAEEPQLSQEIVEPPRDYTDRKATDNETPKDR
eukprot:scaffold2991_cov250-Pinguiococcus_pyrenoidosus.AAC.2